MIKRRIDTNTAIKTELKRMAEKNLARKKEYELYKSVSNAANGTNSKNITFERFVLAAFLEDILKAANMRLEKMTGNRYYLQRTEELRKYGRTGGLELEVFDNNTGRARQVKTLSGGETFMASLAMALGLSDVVQSTAGGVKLDTIFIDEGFGSLDPDALEQAIEVLVELHEAGRVVGIISHVTELKDRIDAKLVVEAGPSGSKARFVV